MSTFAKRRGNLMNQKEFEATLARKDAKGFKGRIENSPPIGMLPNGKLIGMLPNGRLNVVEPGSPKFTPTIIAPAMVISMQAGVRR
jgi:hypothetical protein